MTPAVTVRSQLIQKRDGRYSEGITCLQGELDLAILDFRGSACNYVRGNDDLM